MVRYGGFWLRFLALSLDVCLLLLVTIPLLLWFYGPQYLNSMNTFHFQGPADFFLQTILPLVGTIIFWHYRSATPGKMICRLVIADATTLQKPSTKQFIIRYFAYMVSSIPFCLGFLWVAFDKRKQGWHDKIAKTVVIRKA